MADLLRMDYINSLPQPFMATLYGGSRWPVHDIDVQTGLVRVDVIGKLDILNFADVRMIEDAEGRQHDPETFYSDYEEPQA